MVRSNWIDPFRLCVTSLDFYFIINCVHHFLMDWYNWMLTCVGWQDNDKAFIVYRTVFSNHIARARNTIIHDVEDRGGFCNQSSGNVRSRNKSEASWWLLKI